MALPKHVHFLAVLRLRQDPAAFASQKRHHVPRPVVVAVRHDLDVKMSRQTDKSTGHDGDGWGEQK